MKNLIEKAKEFNLFTREELPGILFDVQPNLNYSYSEKIEDAKINLPSDLLNKYNPTLFFEVREQYNHKNIYEYTYLENIYTIFETPKGHLALIRGYKGKYSFFPFYGYYRKLHNVSYNINKELGYLGIKEPNRIGVFSDKKIIDWLNFVDIEIGLIEDIKDRNKNENEKIEQKIERIKNAISGEVSKYNNSTTIKKEGFIIELNHDKKNNNLYTNIEYRGVVEDVIKLFNKLS